MFSTLSVWHSKCMRLQRPLTRSFYLCYTDCINYVSDSEDVEFTGGAAASAAIDRLLSGRIHAICIDSGGLDSNGPKLRSVLGADRG